MHNAWYSDLSTSAGRRAGVEFACSSVSSPGFEAFFGGNAAAVQGFEQINTALINDLHYLDASRRGHLEESFTSSAATGVWKYVSDLTTEPVATTTGRTETYA
ncbi:alkaline phosphatase D family protein [Hymenobacter wooponensis]|uniref:Uncharacterized protein n=1 Tax=Hymenobacter wooponensis TaxID=1525360 RepID=A0A4Z0MJU4_9BACT|nr:alkaline phosphatase D family protein [Hymenobacter wooponensis]TGD79620.1 hypothetical protein EU557_15485 [Hymenobacter wooponensis]